MLSSVVSKHLLNGMSAFLFVKLTMVAEQTKNHLKFGYIVEELYVKKLWSKVGKRENILFSDEQTANKNYRAKYSSLDKANTLLVSEADDTGLDSCSRLEYWETSCSSGIVSSRRLRKTCLVNLTLMNWILKMELVYFLIFRHSFSSRRINQ